MSLEFKSVKEAVKGQGKLITIYGRPGAGKTYLAAQFPGKKMMLQVNENGLGSIEDREDVATTSITSWKDFDEFLNNIDSYIEQTQAETIIIDTLSGVQELFLNYSAKGNMPKIGDYGDWSVKAGAMCALFKSIVSTRPINVVLIAHEKNFAPKSEKFGGEQVGEDYGASLTESASSRIHASSNIVIRLVQEEKELLDANKNPIINEITGEVEKEVSRFAILLNSATSRVKIQTTNEKVKNIKKEVKVENLSYEKLLKLF